jgi:uncharacterized protein YebE (UPF0316 family)
MIEARCKKMLTNKYALKLTKEMPIEEKGIYERLNSNLADDVNRKLSANLITVVRNNTSLLPIRGLAERSIAVVNIGEQSENEFTRYVKKYAKVDVGRAVLYVNILIACGAIFVFGGIERSLLSLIGLFANSFIIDGVIDNFHSCKYFVVITDKTELVAEYIMNQLHHGVTITDAIGAYTMSKKGMIHTVCRRYEAIKLRAAIKEIDENAFIVITTSSEIIGKGFRSV